MSQLLFYCYDSNVCMYDQGNSEKKIFNLRNFGLRELTHLLHGSKWGSRQGDMVLGHKEVPIHLNLHHISTISEALIRTEVYIPDFIGISIIWNAYIKRKAT